MQRQRRNDVINAGAASWPASSVSDEVRFHAFADQGHEFRVHERVFVRNIENVDAQVVNEFWELLTQPPLVLMFHHEHPIRPL